MRITKKVMRELRLKLEMAESQFEFDSTIGVAHGYTSHIASGKALEAARIAYDTAYQRIKEKA